jgi:hypothetical protein
MVKRINCTQVGRACIDYLDDEAGLRQFDAQSQVFERDVGDGQGGAMAVLLFIFNSSAP